MLNRIIIDNFATIEHLSFDLGKSLNIITGETGAGKSVLIQAISTALGDRADTTMVRNGCERALIQVACEKNNEEYIISREILQSGKSICKINGELVSLTQIKDFCSDLVDIHGQYDNQKILNPDNHILITDSYEHNSISPSLEKLSKLYQEYKTAEKDYNEVLHAESTARQQKDFYQFEYDYIDKLNLIPHEDEELFDKVEMMRNSERIFSAINTSYSLLHEEENSILSSLSKISNELNSISTYSESITHLAGIVNDTYYSLEDISDRLRDLTASISYSDEEMDEISQRLSVIEDAKRKYNKSLDDIIIYKNELQDKLNLISNFDIEKEKLYKIKERKYSELYDAAEHVSELRHIISKKLEKQICQELKDLDFSNSDFKINIEKTTEIGPLGFDKIEFLISTNPGEPLMPLTKIASGGEISRIMLAFKHIIGNSDRIETMIFDEIDTGISGKTALVVGKKLKEISSNHQIVCITHLPQIASYGEDNYLITKNTDDDKTYTEIEHLDLTNKIKMVAMLFSGSDDASAVEAAKELIDKVN